MVAQPAETITVTAALIPSRGRIFIAQRPPLKRFGLLWEFPGGKVESGEGLRASLVREIGEELCWRVQVNELFRRVRFRLHESCLDLHAFWCTIEGGRLCLREHVACYWAYPEELSRFPFTLADQQLVASLQQLESLPDQYELHNFL